MITKLAPIIIFAYKRLDTLQKTIDALRNCEWADQSEIYIFSDGYKNEKDRAAILRIRKFLDSVTGFKNITIYKSEHNKGLGKSIIEGVTKIFETHDSVIVLEDDLVSSKNFIQYMNQCLSIYKDFGSVFSISGYNYPFTVKEGETNDVYFLPRSCSWGWATWKNRWETIDWEIKDYSGFSKNKSGIHSFNQGGRDLFAMLKKQQAGIIDSWAIKWVYNQFKQGSYTVYPMVSKILNIGFNDEATNTNAFNRGLSALDTGEKSAFSLPIVIEVNPFYHKQLLRYYSLKSRIIGKINTLLFKMKIITGNFYAFIILY